MTHTHGPWKVGTENLDGSLSVSVSVQKGRTAGFTPIARIAKSTDNQEGNAYLIAAAPEMKQELRDAFATIRMWRESLAAILNAERMDKKMIRSIIGDIVEGCEISEDKLENLIAKAEGS